MPTKNKKNSEVNPTPQQITAVYYLLFIIAKRKIQRLFCCQYTEIMHNHELLVLQLSISTTPIIMYTGQ